MLFIYKEFPVYGKGLTSPPSHFDRREKSRDD
jgi:hypothetical protein